MENIIVLHDDLSAPLGSMNIDPMASYNGNRAILSIHNNLNALKLDSQFHKAQDEVIRLLMADLQARGSKDV